MTVDFQAKQSAWDKDAGKPPDGRKRAQNEGEVTGSAPLPSSPGESADASKPAAKSGKAGGGKREKMVYVAGPGHGSGCGHCTGLVGGMMKKSEARDAREQMKQKSYDEVMQHEMAHASGLGAYGGSPVVNTDAEGFATDGHVAVSYPSADPENPEEAISAGAIIEQGAMAPSDPSSQDYKVAATAQKLAAKGNELLTKKKAIEQSPISDEKRQVKLANLRSLV